jgi:murein endopeptidase
MVPLLIFCATSVWAAERSEAVGHYWNGKLLGGVNGTEYFKDKSHYLVFLSLPAYQYATVRLLNALQAASLWAKKEWNGEYRLQIGDVAQKGGGKLLAHIDHQMGLEADIGYLSTHRGKPVTRLGRRFKEIFVKDGKLLPRFDVQKNFRLLAYLVKNQPVQRVLMDCEVKRALIRYTPVVSDDVSPELRQLLVSKLLVRANHIDHFHLRLSCDPQDTQCSVAERNLFDVNCP